MVLALHIVALAVGFYFFCLTYVMRKSTEGEWLNRIEELWVRVDDRSKGAGETTKRLVSAIGEKVAKTLSRIVGSKIVSARLVGISGSLSFTSLFLFYGLFFEWISYIVWAHSDLVIRTGSSGATLVRSVPLLIAAGIVSFLISGLYATLAILPVLFKRPIWAWVSCSPTALVVVLFVRLIYWHLASGRELALVAALAISLASDVLLLMVVRQSLRWMLARTSIPRTIITIAIQLFLFFAVFLLPVLILLAEARAGAKGSLAVGMFMLGLLNIPTAFASVSLLFSLFIVLLHRLIWPLFSQLTYILTRNNVLDKRRAVRAIAGGLILWGLSGLPGTSLLIKIFEKVLG